MGLRIVSFWLVGFLIQVHCFGQRIVDQISIDQESSVFLFEPLSLYAFAPSLAVGDAFPDFETISTEEDVFSLGLILEMAISNQQVPVIAFGRPSCNFLRAAYQNLIIPVKTTSGEDLSIYHIAPSIEAHPTNGYESPYFTINQGDTISGNVVIPDNIGYEFIQPFSGLELSQLTGQFINKMVETQVGLEEDFGQITILLDDLNGGFTQAFKGPSIVWVLNPFSGKVVYEETDFGCYYNPIDGCQQARFEFLNAIQEVKQLYQLVGIETQEPTHDWIEIKGLSLLGQNVNEDHTLFYNPVTKVKEIRPAQ